MFHLIDRPTKSNLQETVTQLSLQSKRRFKLSFVDGGVRLHVDYEVVTPLFTKREMAIWLTALRRSSSSTALAHAKVHRHN
jgi:hypothetical protein